MSFFSWFNSPDQLSSISFWIAAIGGLVELGVAVGALVDLRSEHLPKEREKLLERYIALMAVLAATCAFASLFFSHRSENLESQEQQRNKQRYDVATLAQSNRLVQTETQLTVATQALASVQLKVLTLADRHIRPEQRLRILAALTNAPKGEISVEAVNEEEPRNFANEIASALTEAGFTVHADTIRLNGMTLRSHAIPPGLRFQLLGDHAAAPAHVFRILYAFTNAGFLPDSFTYDSSFVKDDILRISVGHKRLE